MRINRIMLRVGIISVDPKWNTKVKAFYLVMIDAEERR